MDNKKIYMLMTISSSFWAGAFIAGKVGVQELSPIQLTFMRFFIASIIIFGVMVKYEKKDWRLKKKAWLDVILIGIIGMVGYHILFFTSLKYTTASNSSMIAATNPLFTAILASIFAGEKLGIRRVGYIIMAFIGVILTISKWNINIITNLSFNKGDLIMIGAVICWVIYSIISKNIMPKYSPLILTTYSFIVCTVILLPFVIRDGLLINLGNISWKGWVSVIYMAVFPTVIGYLIQQMAIKEVGAGKMAIFINLVPVFSIIMAYFILHETIPILNLVSAGMIIVAVYLNSRVKANDNKELLVES